MAFFNDIKEKVNKAAQSVSSKTKDNVEFSRLASEGKGIMAELETLYNQIGRAFVDSEGAASEALDALRARVGELRTRLEEVERQKLQRKNLNLCPACGAVVAKDAHFCSNCGERLPEPEPEPEPVIATQPMDPEEMPLVEETQPVEPGETLPVEEAQAAEPAETQPAGDVPEEPTVKNENGEE